MSQSPPISVTQIVLEAFHQSLAEWYHRQARDLPWRRTVDPYAITVSELMLQQTQVVTVIPYYERWLAQFPNWATLATAPDEEILKAWEGLGYYTRARNLQRLARQVMERGGDLPQTPGELVKLAGIGPYTAGAVASLAFGQRAALVDGNVMRVFARVFNLRQNISDRTTQQSMWSLAEQLLPPAQFCAVHNSALMELGATLCTPTKPQCLLCPLKLICQAEEPETLPIKTRPVIEQKEEEIALLEEQGRWWVIPGPAKGRLANFWRFPEFFDATMIRGQRLTSFSYGITRYRIRLQAFQASWKCPPVTNGRWMTPSELNSLPMSSAHGRLRDLVKSLGLTN